MNEADSVVFRAEKALKDFKDKIPSDVTTDVQNKIDALKKALESKDVSRVKQAKQELEEHMQKIGEAMSKAGHAPGQEAPHAEQAASQPHHEAKAPEQDIEDAEVEIIDKDDNK